MTTQAPRALLRILLLTFSFAAAGSGRAQPALATNNPAITQQPQSQVGIIGATVTFTVQAQGTPPPAYQWEFNGNAISNAFSSSLTLTNVQLSNSGAYLVIVSNSLGSITSSVATLGFPMSVIKGVYSALFANETTSPSNSGTFTLTASKSGAFTVKVQMGYTRYTGLSQFTGFGGAEFLAVPANGGVPLSIALEVNPQDTNTLIGAIWSENWAPESLSATRNMFDRRTNPAPVQGQYTMLIEPTNISTSMPQGSSVASAKIDAAGKVRFAGSLADGTKFTGSSQLSQSLECPLYASLYHGRGMLFGELAFTNASGTNFQGDVLWTKPANSSRAAYPSGFSTTNAAFGFAYSKPQPGRPVLNFTQATLVLEDGPIGPALMKSVTLDERNRLTTAQPGELKASVNRSTGLMRGSFLSPGNPGAISLQGAVLQSQDAIEGFGIQNGLSVQLLVTP